MIVKLFVLTYKEKSIKRDLMRSLIIFFLFFLLPSLAFCEKIIIKLRPDTTVEAVLGEVMAKKKYLSNNIYVVQIKKGVDVSKIISHLRGDPRVIYVESIKKGRFKGFDTLETVFSIEGGDYEGQWYLEMMEVQPCWYLSKGQGIVIGLIDSGVDYNASDIQGRILSGYDFGDDDNDPFDLNGHGTMMAHIMVAKKNGYGVAGIAPKAMILPIKINPGGEGTFETDRLVEAIFYAVGHRVSVINLSLVLEEYSEAVRDAIDYALFQGIVVIAAAGNDGLSKVSFPASYEPVISVGSVDGDGTVSLTSNYGMGIDLVAPAGLPGIYTIGLNETVYLARGTSLSAAMVSAICADMLGANDGLTPSDLFNFLKATASHPLVWEILSGYGLVNAKRAVQKALGLPVGEEIPYLSLNLISLFYPFLPYPYFTFDIYQYQYIWIDALRASPAPVDIYLEIFYPDGRSAFLTYGRDGLAQLREERLPLMRGCVFDDLEDFIPVMFLAFSPYDEAMKADMPSGSYVWRMEIIGNGESIEEYLQTFYLFNHY